MALKALTCPQCGANLSLDDSRDFGFCQYCGTKVMLHETIEVKHTGTVKFDTTGQELNLLRLANGAFSAGNFAEAYSYYTRVLEYNPTHIVALYLKGVCAVYVSDQQNIRINEYVQAVTQSKRVAADNVQNKKMLVDLESYSVGIHNYWINRGMPSQPMSQEQGECISEFSKAASVAVLIQNVVALVESETTKESIILSGIDFISKAQSAKLSYISGSVTDKKGRTSPVYKSITIQPNQNKILNDVKEYLKITYNNLPSRVATANDINIKMGDIDNNINQLKETLKEKNKQRMTSFKEFIKDRKNPMKKAELSNLDAEISSLNSQLNNFKNAKKELMNSSKAFNNSLL